ncbi:hypothetical protein E2C01_053840 [Portunus trituberculatus]|uniref:Uncharacterized protein n=1 Tax=Portunus trituberculatus TaxID=210409 RepID=A0A5B7GLE3_PORTR|nr:hypothetical protein [Portunus trituberculatus]
MTRFHIQSAYYLAILYSFRNANIIRARTSWSELVAVRGKLPSATSQPASQPNPAQPTPHICHTFHTQAALLI